jgi:hypothetical protein
MTVALFSISGQESGQGQGELLAGLRDNTVQALRFMGSEGSAKRVGGCLTGLLTLCGKGRRVYSMDMEHATSLGKGAEPTIDGSPVPAWVRSPDHNLQTAPPPALAGHRDLVPRPTIQSSPQLREDEHELLDGSKPKLLYTRLDRSTEPSRTSIPHRASVRQERHTHLQPVACDGSGGGWC